MHRTDAIAWVLSICQPILRKSQAKTLSVLVAAALSAMRLSLAGIGREMAAAQDGSAKHAIKRVWRFLTNDRVEPAGVMPLVINRLLRQRLAWHGKKPARRPLLVSLDWTKVRSFHVLMAAIVVEGRAVPLCWQSYRDRVQGRSQNALENAMMMQIKATLPAQVKVVILADRGFRRASLIRLCQHLQLDYLIRICDDVVVQTARWRGNLRHYPRHRGMCRGFPHTLYREDGSVQTHLIVRWKRGLPTRKDQPWYVVTSLPLDGRGRPRHLSDLYARRFDIEQLFRDTKNEHLGWSLAKTRITRADRLDRLILIAALAYVLLAALGLWCRKQLDPPKWCTNSRSKELSIFAIARTMLHRVVVPVHTAISLLLSHLATTEGNWG